MTYESSRESRGASIFQVVFAITGFVGLLGLVGVGLDLAKRHYAAYQRANYQEVRISPHPKARYKSTPQSINAPNLSLVR